jgi:hypothetical protein
MSSITITKSTKRKATTSSLNSTITKFFKPSVAEEVAFGIHPESTNEISPSQSSNDSTPSDFHLELSSSQQSNDFDSLQNETLVEPASNESSDLTSEVELAISTSSTIVHQSDPAVGSNLFEFNLKPIQPVIDFPSKLQGKALRRFQKKIVSRTSLA